MAKSRPVRQTPTNRVPHAKPAPQISGQEGKRPAITAKNVGARAAEATEFRNMRDGAGPEPTKLVRTTAAPVPPAPASAGRCEAICPIPKGANWTDPRCTRQATQGSYCAQHAKQHGAARQALDTAAA